MNTIGDFSIIEKCHEDEDRVTMQELKRAMEILKVPLTHEEIQACWHEMHVKKLDTSRLLSKVVTILMTKRRTKNVSFQTNQKKAAEDSPRLPAKSKQNWNEEVRDEKLVPCSEGCGRNFNSDSMGKHAKVCRRVFQSKRDVFDSAEARRTFAMASFARKNPNATEPAKSCEKKNVILLSKFKRQCLARLKKEGNKHPDMISCPERCGRTFIADSLEKHAKVCKKVFQSKRPKFNSVAARKTKEMVSLALKKSKASSRSSIKPEKKEVIPLAEFKKRSLAKLKEEETEHPNMFKCTEGCGRTFTVEALEKHAKNCKQVFQTKRHRFNSAIARKTEEMADVAAKLSMNLDSIACHPATRAHYKKEVIPISEFKKQCYSQLHNQEDDNPELIPCSEGCGRTFTRKALKAHAPVCKQVFQDKREKFDSSDKRKSKDLKYFETIPYKKSTKNWKVHVDEHHKNDEISKWRNESNAFRRVVKALKEEKELIKHPKWKCQSQTFRTMVNALRGEKRTPLGSLSTNIESENANARCPNCHCKVNTTLKSM